MNYISIFFAVILTLILSFVFLKPNQMVMHTDYSTGCHYLSSGFFGRLTPRLDAKGRHIGCYKK